MEAGNQEIIDSFKVRYREIYDKLKERLESGKIDAITHHRIIMLSKKIINALAHNKTIVREEAERIMGGQVLITETDILLQEGEKIGIEKGVKQLDDLNSWLKAQNRTDDIIRAVGNEAVRNELLEEYQKANGQI